jgi:transcriptional regulator with XRE-family HTH domain
MYVKRIKEIREVLGLSVPKLAERINIKARTIVSYESGRDPSVEFLAQLHKVYNVNLNWFVSGQGEMFIGTQKQPPEDIQKLVSDLVDAKFKEKGLY